MATTGKFNGTLFMVNVAGTDISHSKDATLSISSDMIETTTKDSSGYKEYIPGEKGGEITCSGLWAFDATYGIDELITAQLAGTQVTVLFTTGVSGDKRISASAYITDISGNAPQNDAAAFDITFQLTGTLTWETIV